MENGLPKSLKEALQIYLFEEEKILDWELETFIPRIDLRWVIITTKNVIIAKRELVDYRFISFLIKNIEVNLELGFLFDEVEFSVAGKSYKAQFYSTKRDRTIKLFKKIKVLSEAKKKKEYEFAQPIQSLLDLIELKKKGIISNKEYKILEDELMKRIK